MKNILIFLLVATAILVSCKKEAIIPLSISDFEIAIGTDVTGDVLNMPVNGYLTFLDVSQNIASHEWIISDGNNFISDEFSPADTDFAEFIIPGSGTSSTDAKVNVLFNQSGLQSVRIVNTFDSEPAPGPVQAVQEGAVWKIDTTYAVDVYADILPAFKVSKGGVEVLSVSGTDIPDPANSASWPVVEVEAGQMLTFEDVTTIGRPNGRSWTFDGAVPGSSSAASATVSYFSLGDFVGGQFVSERGGSLPQQNATKVIPINIKVVPSTQPFLYDGNMNESVDQVITFNVGGELEPFSGEEGAFTVNVKNDISGFDEAIPVQRAKVSDNDATLVELTLSAPIFNSDVVTVSYSGTGLKSADFRTLSDFGPETVTMHFEDNLLPTAWSSFEVADANWKKGFCQGVWIGNSNGSTGNPHFSRTEEMAASGASCMKLDLYNGMENKTLQGSDFKTFGITAGSYLIEMKVFLAVGNNMTTLQSFVQKPATTLDWDITNAPRGEWITLSQTASFGAVANGRFDFKVVANLNPATTDPQILFLDDYSWKPLETR